MRKPTKPQPPQLPLTLPADARAIVNWLDPRAAPIPGYAVRANGTVLWWCKHRRCWLECRPKVDKSGFVKVRIRMGDKLREIGLAHLVLRAFVGPRPLGCEPLHFPDPRPANNRLENLRWAPRGESKRGRMLAPTGPPQSGRGNDHHHAVLTAEDIPLIRELYRAGVAYKEIAERLDVEDETVRQVLLGKTWRHIPDPLGPITMRRKGPPSHEARLSVLDWDKAREIRRLHAAGISTKDLAARYGVARITIQQLLAGRTWKEPT